MKTRSPTPVRTPLPPADARFQTFAQRWAAALAAVRLYPAGNPMVETAVERLVEAAAHLTEAGASAVVVRQGEHLCLGGSGLELDLGRSPGLAELRALLEGHRVNRIEVAEGVAATEWQAFLEVLARDPAVSGETSKLARSLEEAGVEAIEVESGPRDLPRDLAAAGAGSGDPSAQARLAYQESVEGVREIYQRAQEGRALEPDRATSAVRPIVKAVLQDRVSIMAMTALRDFDEYTFTHSVNVAVFSALIGHEIGLKRDELQLLAMAALLHDLGKTRIDPEVINKEGPLSDLEFETIQDHPMEGLLLLGSAGPPSRRLLHAMLVAYEHHMGANLTGYPRVRRPRTPGLFTRIVAVADSYDALTSHRCYRPALRPDQVLLHLADPAVSTVDPALVRVLIQVTGLYPVGSVVRLDTGEVGVVVAPASDPARIRRPVVKVVKGEGGESVRTPFVVDLAQPRPEGRGYLRSIVRSVAPEEVGVAVSRHLE